MWWVVVVVSLVAVGVVWGCIRRKPLRHPPRSLCPMANVAARMHAEYNGDFQTMAVVRLKGPLPTSLLGRALDRSVTRYPHLGKSQVYDKASKRFFFRDTDSLSTVPLREVEVSSHAEWLRAVNCEADEALALDSPPLLRAVVLRHCHPQEEGLHTLLVTIPHSVADGVSLAAFTHSLLADIASECTTPVEPTPLGVLKAPSHAMSVAQVLHFAYTEIRKGLRRQVLFPTLQGSKGERRTSFLSLSTDDTTTLLQAAKSRRCTPWGVFAAAAAKACATDENAHLTRERGEWIHIGCPVSLRKDHSVGADQMGLLVGSGDVQIPRSVAEELGFWDLAGKLRSMVEKAKERSGKLLDVTATLLPGPEITADKHTTMLVNNLGLLPIQGRYGPITVELFNWYGKVERFGPTLMIQCATLDGRLQLLFSAHESVFPQITRHMLSTVYRETSVAISI